MTTQIENLYNNNIGSTKTPPFKPQKDSPQHNNKKFDLNIENYDTEELEELLELPKNYTNEIIKIQELKIIKNIIDNKSINLELKSEIISFIECKVCYESLIQLLQF